MSEDDYARGARDQRAQTRAWLLARFGWTSTFELLEEQGPKAEERPERPKILVIGHPMLSSRTRRLWEIKLSTSPPGCAAQHCRSGRRALAAAKRYAAAFDPPLVVEVQKPGYDPRRSKG